MVDTERSPLQMDHLLFIINFLTFDF